MGALLPVRCAPLVWSPWIGGRGLAATVRPSYCQRCPDSPTLNTPGSLPGALSDVRRWLVWSVVAGLLSASGRRVGSWPVVWLVRGDVVAVAGVPGMDPPARLLPRCGLVAGGAVRCAPLVCGWVVNVAGCGFHRRGCSLDVGWCGRLGDVAAGWSVWFVVWLGGRCGRVWVSSARLLGVAGWPPCSWYGLAVVGALSDVRRWFVAAGLSPW